jgi:hypothetical protein
MRWRVVAAALGLAIFASEGLAHAKPDDPPTSQSEKEAREKSRAAFRAGVSQLQAKDWKAARSSFETAWALYPHPSILLNLGIARLRTDDPVLAEQDFVKFLSEDSGSTAEELAAARDALAEARTKIGTIRVVASPAAARIVVDGKTIPERVSGGDAAVAEIRAKAGKHSVLVDAEGHVPQERNVDLAPRADIEVKVTLAPKEGAKGGGPANGTGPTPGGDDGPSGRTVLGYGLAGLSGVAIAAGAFCGFRTLSLASEHEQTPSADVKSQGETFRTLTDVAFGVAIVSGVAAIVLLFTDVGSSKPTSSNAVANAMKRAPLMLRW